MYVFVCVYVYVQGGSLLLFLNIGVLKLCSSSPYPGVSFPIEASWKVIEFNEGAQKQLVVIYVSTVQHAV